MKDVSEAEKLVRVPKGTPLYTEEGSDPAGGSQVNVCSYAVRCQLRTGQRSGKKPKRVVSQTETQRFSFKPC